MNRKYIVQLTEEERSQLQQIISSGTAPARKIRRAHILLKSDSSPQGPNGSYQAIGAAFDVSATTITTVRRAYCAGGLEAALNRKKPEREYPHRLDGEAEAHLIAVACSQPPEGHARWSLRLVRDRFGEMGYVEQVSHETIRQVLKSRKTLCFTAETQRTSSSWDHYWHILCVRCALCGKIATFSAATPKGRGAGGEGR